MQQRDHTCVCMLLKEAQGECDVHVSHGFMWRQSTYMFILTVLQGCRVDALCASPWTNIYVCNSVYIYICIYMRTIHGIS